LLTFIFTVGVSGVELSVIIVLDSDFSEFVLVTLIFIVVAFVSESSVDLLFASVVSVEFVFEDWVLLDCSFKVSLIAAIVSIDAPISVNRLPQMFWSFILRSLENATAKAFASTTTSQACMPPGLLSQLFCIKNHAPISVCTPLNAKLHTYIILVLACQCLQNITKRGRAQDSTQ
jgi:hypothetical protein